MKLSRCRKITCWRTMAQRSDGPHTPPPPLVIEDDFNHYEVLGVEPTADSAELKRAFAAAAKTHHPDKSEGTPSAFLRVQRAYEVLRDASSRRSYDATLVELRRRRLLFTPGSNELLPRTAATPVPVACVAVCSPPVIDVHPHCAIATAIATATSPPHLS